MTAPAWLTERPIAHRGLHRGSEIPENTEPAFQAAIDAGLPIELDVQLTADDQLVVHHDDALGRLTEASGPVRERSLAELTAMTIAGDEHRIMSFPEVLAFVDGRVPLLIEIKTGEAKETRSAAVARDLEGYTGEFAVQSFDPFIVGWFRKNAPEILRGQLSGSFSNEKDLSAISRKALQNLALNVVSRPHFIAYELSFIGPRRAKLLRRLRKPLLLWTVTTQEQRRKAESIGDNIIFEGFTP
mgnify:CR=1 FL=1